MATLKELIATLHAKMDALRDLEAKHPEIAQTRSPERQKKLVSFQQLETKTRAKLATTKPIIEKQAEMPAVVGVGSPVAMAMPMKILAILAKFDIDPNTLDLCEALFCKGVKLWCKEMEDALSEFKDAANKASAEPTILDTVFADLVKDGIGKLAGSYDFVLGLTERVFGYFELIFPKKGGMPVDGLIDAWAKRIEELKADEVTQKTLYRQFKAANSGLSQDELFLEINKIGEEDTKVLPSKSEFFKILFAAYLQTIPIDGYDWDEAELTNKAGYLTIYYIGHDDPDSRDPNRFFVRRNDSKAIEFDDLPEKLVTLFKTIYPPQTLLVELPVNLVIYVSFAYSSITVFREKGLWSAKNTSNPAMAVEIVSRALATPNTAFFTREIQHE